MEERKDAERDGLIIHPSSLPPMISRLLIHTPPLPSILSVTFRLRSSTLSRPVVLSSGSRSFWGAFVVPCSRKHL